MKIERIITDNGACHRSGAFATALRGTEHRRTRLYTPKYNDKVGRCNRAKAEEFLYARIWTSELQRERALESWNLHYNYHRPHGAHDGRPAAFATPSRTTTSWPIQLRILSVPWTVVSNIRCRSFVKIFTWRS